MLTYNLIGGSLCGQIAKGYLARTEPISKLTRAVVSFSVTIQGVNQIGVNVIKHDTILISTNTTQHHTQRVAICRKPDKDTGSS